MNVKITSNGEPCGTSVTDGAGRNLDNMVTAVRWSHRAGELPRAEIDLSLIEFEVSGQAAIVGPGGRRVRRIEYEDGTMEDFSIEPVELNTGAHKESVPMSCLVRKARVPQDQA